MKLPANFLVVRVRPSGWKMGLFIALPLFVVEDALEAVALLARAGLRVGHWFGRGRVATGFSGRVIEISRAAGRTFEPGGAEDTAGRDADGDKRRADADVDVAKLLAQLVHVPAALIRGLRSYGRLVLAEVRDGDTHVSVRLL